MKIGNIKCGQWVEHKYRKEEGYVKVSFIKDSKVFIDGMSESFWFLDNVKRSEKLIHKIYNFFIR